MQEKIFVSGTEVDIDDHDDEGLRANISRLIKAFPHPIFRKWEGPIDDDGYVYVRALDQIFSESGAEVLMKARELLIPYLERPPEPVLKSASTEVKISAPINGDFISVRVPYRDLRPEQRRAHLLDVISKADFDPITFAERNGVTVRSVKQDLYRTGKKFKVVKVVSTYIAKGNY